MKESELYLPLKQFLESKNYEVKAEVQSCDVLAIKDEEEPIIVELKLSLNFDVLLQAVDRLTLSSAVYIGIPKDCKSFKKKRKKSIKLLKMLGFGLILIGEDENSVDVIVEPTEYRPRKSKQKKARLLDEFQKREGDPNIGGMSTKKGVLTSYRQRALKVAEYLKEHGQNKASNISKEINEPKARDIMYNNYYGWFEKVSLGVYTISSKGLEEIEFWLNKDNMI